MMGAGKTTVGRQLARRLGKPFYDTDREVELKTGVRVSIIFEIEGEAGFRRREAETIEHMTGLATIVLATGGGAVLAPENREHLKTRGLVIYLHAQPRELWQRTRNDKTRPLLQVSDARQRIERLYGERDPLYRDTADIVIETGRQGIAMLMAQLVAKLGEPCVLSA
jgi:shikimate kinase